MVAALCRFLICGGVAGEGVVNVHDSRGALANSVVEAGIRVPTQLGFELHGLKGDQRQYTMPG